MPGRRALSVRPPHRRRVGSAGQHLRLRWLRQSRVVKFDKNGRFIAQGREQRAATSHISSTRRTRSPSMRRATCTSAIAATAHPGVRQRPDASSAIYDNVGNPWAVCISPGRTSISSRRTPTPTPTRRQFVGRHRRDLQDGARRQDHRQVRQGRQGSASSSTVHEIDCRNPELFVSEISAWRAQKIILNPSVAADRGSVR